MNVWQILAIAAGGAIGAVLRGLAGIWLESSFPWATLLVNVVGSFIIGFIFGLEVTHLQLHPHLRALLTTGFCGALTTFSTFSYQTLGLFNSGQYWAGAASILLNLVLTLLAVWVGLKAANIAFS